MGRKVESFVVAQKAFVLDENNKKISTIEVGRSIIDGVADCHGLTFADNRLWIDNKQVNILLEDEYEKVGQSEADIVVFKAAKDGDGGERKGEIIHSAIVKSNGKYKSNAGDYPSKDNLSLEEAGGKAFGGKIMTDLNYKDNKFKATNYFKRREVNPLYDNENITDPSGQSTSIAPGVKLYEENEINKACPKG